MRVVADSHAVVWYLQGSKLLSERAAEVLGDAESERVLEVSDLQQMLDGSVGQIPEGRR